MPRPTQRPTPNVLSAQSVLRSNARTLQTVYKMTNSHSASFEGNCVWGTERGYSIALENRGHVLHAPGMLHAFTGDMLAVLFAPLYKDSGSYALWRASAVPDETDGITLGTHTLITHEQVDIPPWSGTEQHKRAILATALGLLGYLRAHVPAHLTHSVRSALDMALLAGNTVAYIDLPDMRNDIAQSTRSLSVVDPARYGCMALVSITKICENSLSPYLSNAIVGMLGHLQTAIDGANKVGTLLGKGIIGADPAQIIDYAQLVDLAVIALSLEGADSTTLTPALTPIAQELATLGQSTQVRATNAIGASPGMTREPMSPFEGVESYRSPVLPPLDISNTRWSADLIRQMDALTHRPVRR